MNKFYRIYRSIIFALLFVLLVVPIHNIYAQEPDTTIYNKVWVLQKINNKKIIYKENSTPITLIITEENEYASGSSGCNTYVAQVVIKRNHLMFRSIGTTKMACPEESIANERIYLNNLNEIDSYKIIDEDLYLFKNQRPILVFYKE